MLLIQLAACSGMNNQDAHMVFERANSVGFDTYVDLYSDSSNAGERDSGVFTWTSTDDGFTFEGSVTGTSDWTGTVEVSGEASWTATTFSGAWSLDYIDVVEDGVTLNGGLDWTLDLEGDHDSGSLEYGVFGEVTADGDASGTGEVDYTANVEITTNSFSFVAEGTIDGTPIDSSFTLTVL
ncbi:MAG: hypothetical protein GY913_09185 [Proteobacteria bacterium]|nr:hypothetical protein [Pseudomonadota bacterium]MCP4917085.1 hypothetical protein [Pseudomonadota bacterium]